MVEVLPGVFRQGQVAEVSICFRLTQASKGQANFLTHLDRLCLHNRDSAKACCSIFSISCRKIDGVFTAPEATSGRKAPSVG